MTQKLETPVRLNGPVVIGPYTFKNAVTGAAINLSSDFIATAVKCEIKRRGTAYVGDSTDLLTGAIVTAASGIVRVASHTFTVAGTWTYQFYCTNAGGDKLWGEPVQFEVADNVENLDTNELARL